MDERTQELIQAELDDALGEGEQRHLEAALEHSEEARLYQRQMRQIRELLHDDAEPEFPSELHAAILDSVELPSQKRGLGSYLSSTHMHFRYGFAALATFGLAVGVFMNNPGFELPQETSGLVGTVMPATEANAISDGAIDRFTMDRNNLKAELSLRGSGESYQLQLKANASEPINLMIDLASSGLRLDIGGDRTADPERDATMQIDLQGQKELTINLVTRPGAPAAGNIRHSWQQGDKVLESGYLRIKPESEHD